jgi:sulfur-carrier protein
VERLAVEEITVRIKLFAIYQEAYGTSELVWTFPVDAPIGAVRDRILIEHPELEAWRERTRLGLNLQFVDPTTPMGHGDEVVLIPPVSGG